MPKILTEQVPKKPLFFLNSLIIIDLPIINYNNNRIKIISIRHINHIIILIYNFESKGTYYNYNALFRKIQNNIRVMD